MKIELQDYQYWLNHELFPFAVIGLLGVILLLINRKKLRHSWREWKTRRRLNRIGIKQDANLEFPDGLGGSFKVDRLAMLPDSILLISFKPFSGNIYCADNIPEWTQIVGQKSFKFANPLFEMEYQIKAIRAHVPGVSVRGVVFFDHTASFPKGHPEQVLHPANIPGDLIRDNCSEPNTIVLKAWEAIREIPRHPLQTKPY